MGGHTQKGETTGAGSGCDGVNVAAVTYPWVLAILVVQGIRIETGSNELFRIIPNPRGRLMGKSYVNQFLNSFELYSRIR